METGHVHYGDMPKPEGWIRFVCLSDTHSVPMTQPIPPGDVLLHAGDFSRRGSSKSLVSFSALLGSLPHTHKIVIAGNHEFSFDGANVGRLNKAHHLNVDTNVPRSKSYLTNCTYLEDSGTEVMGYKIWGSPWVNGYRDGGFTLWTEGEIEEKWDLIPRDVDILMTHQPPYGILDENKYKEKGGCRYLERRTADMHLKAHIFGHIHEAHGFEVRNNCIYANVAICTLDYDSRNRPVVIDLPPK
jgi:predicted phosphohydrolase